VVGRARAIGVALQPEAAWLLVAQVGKAPTQIVAELGRLRDRLGADSKRAPLKPSDLRGKLTTSFESTPFEFADAVLGGERKDAYRSLRAIFDRGMRSKDGKPMDPGGLFPFTTSWLYQSLARALEGRWLVDAGASEGDVVAQTGVRQFVDRFVAQVRKHDAATLRRGLLALHACQRASRLTGEEPDVLLERFLGMWFDGAPIPSLEDLEA
jgi:DNA polymerase III delta subunit